MHSDLRLKYLSDIFMHQRIVGVQLFAIGISEEKKDGTDVDPKRAVGTFPT